MLESNEDILGRQILENTIKFEIGLLWKQPNPQLPNNYDTAVKRFLSVERKMNRDVQYAEKYRQAMSKYIDKNYARKVEPHKLECLIILFGICHTLEW